MTEEMTECTMEDLQDPEIEDDQELDDEVIPETELDAQEAENTLASLKSVLMAIPAAHVRLLKVSATSAVGVGLAYAQAYAEDRPVFAQAFRTAVFDVFAYDNMSDRAKAFWRADILMRQLLNSEDPLRMLMIEAKPLRIKLMKAAIYIWGDDPELGDVIATIRSGATNVNKADDLGSLGTLFTEHWDRAQGKCDVTLEDIAEAERLGARILQATISTPTGAAYDVRNLRHRAAEYLRQGIEDVRAAAGYIFRNDEKSRERYPSLFIRKRKKNGNGKTTVEQDTSDAAIAPAGVEVPVESGPEDVQLSPI